MAKCQRPGCGGETAFGKCTECGAPDHYAWLPPEVREQQAARSEDEAGTGWFKHPDVLSGSQPSPPKPQQHAPDATLRAQSAQPQQPQPRTPHGERSRQRRTRTRHRIPSRSSTPHNSSPRRRGLSHRSSCHHHRLTNSHLSSPRHHQGRSRRSSSRRHHSRRGQELSHSKCLSHNPSLTTKP